MTKKAIDLLQGDRDGFFLQVEGASIDKQDHAANACAQIGETIAFDNAIRVAQDYARWHPDATPPAVPPSQQHTGSVVPALASGPGAAAVLRTNDHTDLFEVLGGGHGRR